MRHRLTAPVLLILACTAFLLLMVGLDLRADRPGRGFERRVAYAMSLRNGERAISSREAGSVLLAQLVLERGERQRRQGYVPWVLGAATLTAAAAGALVLTVQVRPRPRPESGAAAA
jgi:hypothetical protein